MAAKYPEKYVITIGRRMGSGGRVVGRKLADRLGIAFYDKELLLDAAKASGLNPEFLNETTSVVPTLSADFFRLV